jgi:hypothetical protein
MCINRPPKNARPVLEKAYFCTRWPRDPASKVTECRDPHHRLTEGWIVGDPSDSNDLDVECTQARPMGHEACVNIE